MTLTTKEQLEERKAELIEIIDNLQKMIESTGSIAFEVVIGTIKNEMNNNIIEEDWKTLKQNQKKIESFRNAELIILNQETTLKKRKKELEDVQTSLNNLQLELPFEENETTSNETLTTTDFVIANDEGNHLRLRVGDVFETFKDNEFWIVKNSAKQNGKFAILKDIDEGELELQYPANLRILDYARFVGNFYEDKEIEKLSAIVQNIYHNKTEDAE